MCLKNGSVGPARPCCFPVLKGCGKGRRGLPCLYSFQKPATTSIIVPKHYDYNFYLMHSDATFDTGGERNVVGKLLRVRARPCWGKCVLKMGPLGRPGHAVSLCGKSFGSEVMKTRKAAKPSFF